MKQAVHRSREAGAAPGECAERAHPARERVVLSGVVSDLGRELEAADMPHAFLRGVDEHPDLPRGSDVDLCLRPRDLCAFTRALEGVCARRGVVIHERFHAGFLSQFYLYAVDGAEGHTFLTLDVHTAEAALGVPFLEAEQLLSERRSASGLRVPDAELSALVDFLSPYLSGGQVQERYARRLVDALEGGGARAQARMGALFGAREARALCAELVGGDRVALEAAYRRRRRGLIARRLLRAPLRTLGAAAAFAYGVRLRPLWRPRGRFIVFLGTDGVGKTSVIEQVARVLGPALRAGELRTLHLRPGLVPQLDRVVHLGRRTQTLADWSRPHRAAPSGRLVSNLRVAWYALDYVLGYALLVLPLRRRPALILFDRYFHDYQVDPLRARVRPGTLLVRLLVHRVPQPDAIVVVTAELEQVCARKQELPPQESARQLAAYEALAARGGRYHLVRNDGRLADAVAAVVRALFPEPAG